MSWHQICAKKEFIESLQRIKDLDLFPDEKVRICCLGDGADWIWEGMSTVFPKARQVLDYYHCAEHLNDFIKVKFGDNPKGNRWLEQTKARLFANNGRFVLAGLKRMKVEGKVQEERDKLYSNFTKLQNYKDKTQEKKISQTRKKRKRQ